VIRFTPCPGTRAATEVHGHGDTRYAVDQSVVHVDRKIGRLVRIAVTGVHMIIDKQAQMEMVDLDDRGPDCASNSTSRRRIDTQSRIMSSRVG